MAAKRERIDENGQKSYRMVADQRCDTGIEAVEMLNVVLLPRGHGRPAWRGTWRRQL
jgi:hypothetical protein